MSTKVETEMILLDAKKHSIRFAPSATQLAAEASGSRPKVLTAIYICNEAISTLGGTDCKKVKITIEQVD